MATHMFGLAMFWHMCIWGGGDCADLAFDMLCIKPDRPRIHSWARQVHLSNIFNANFTAHWKSMLLKFANFRQHRCKTQPAHLFLRGQCNHSVANVYVIFVCENTLNSDWNTGSSASKQAFTGGKRSQGVPVFPHIFFQDQLQRDTGTKQIEIVNISCLWAFLRRLAKPLPMERMPSWTACWSIPVWQFSILFSGFLLEKD